MITIFFPFLDATNISLRKLDPFVRLKNLDQHDFYFLSFFKLQESLQTDKEIKQTDRERKRESVCVVVVVIVVDRD